METVPQMLESAARWKPDHPLVLFDGNARTYREMNQEANRIAHALALRGLPAGAPVALFLPSRPIFISSYYAAMKAGGAAAPLNAMFKPTEVAAMVNYLGAPTLITTPELADTVAQVREETPGLLNVFVWAEDGQSVPAGTEDLRALAAGLPDENPEQVLDPDAVAAVFHTSGTTGRPKGAAQTHANIVLGSRHMVARVGWQLGRERICCPLPLFNNFGSTGILNMTVNAVGTLALIERWDVAAVLAALQAGANRFIGTPTMYIYLLQGHDAAVHGEVRLDACIVGGQTCPSEVRDAFEERFGCRLINLYGATETHVATTTQLYGPHPDDTVGHPVASVQIRIEDNEGNELRPREVGEIVIESELVCAGYWRDPERTAESFGPHGWRSGDLGYRDEDGFVYVVDRKKDLIITGGANIYPAEIEAILYEHPAVALATVIGIPDSVKGEVPKAYVVLKPGAADVTADELIGFMRERLASYKCPRAVEFVDSLPLSPVGKVLKRELRDQVMAALAETRVGVNT